MKRILKSGAVPSQFSWTKPVKARRGRPQKEESSDNIPSTVFLHHSLDGGNGNAEVQFSSVGSREVSPFHWHFLDATLLSFRLLVL